MLLAWTLLACSGSPETAAPPAGEPPRAARTNPDPQRAQSARAAPTFAAPWEGAWTLTVYAATLADPAATALAEGLGLQVTPWEGGRPHTRPGEAAVLWLPVGTDLDAAVQDLAPTGGGPMGDVVAVLAPGDSAWAASAVEQLPWAGVALVDPTLSASLWVDGSVAAADPVVAGRVAAREIADHYGRVYLPTAAPLPPGLDAWLGTPTAGGLTAKDPRTRAATVLYAPPAPSGPAAAVASSVAPLPIDTLVDDPSVGVRLAVAARTTSAKVRARLAADPDPQVRARVADSLDDVALLDTLAADPSSVVRVIATDRLARLAETRPTDVEAPLRRAAGSPDAYQRWKAAFGLGRCPDGLDALVPMLGDPDIDVRREAARSLGRHPDPRAVDALVLALGDKNSFVRRWAAEALGRIRDPRAGAPLHAAAADPTSLVAQAAARALTAMGEPTGAPEFHPPKTPRDDAELDGWLASADATVRKDAAKFLAERADAGPKLAKLAADPDSEVRKSAVEAMGWSAASAVDVIPFLDDPDPDVLVTALDALRRAGIGPVERLTALRAHPDAEVRLRAAEALAAQGPSDALAACLDDRDERVRAAAAAAYPDRVSASEPSSLVRRAAGRQTDPDPVVSAAAGSPLAGWAEGVFAREDDLLHLRFSWNEPSDRPAAYRALRPPVLRAYGHPDRG